MVEATNSGIDLPAVLRNRTALFWIFQLAGWTGISLVSYFSLNLWYNQPEAEYIAHNILQSVLGILVSWPMRPIYRRLWHVSLLPRLLITALVVLLLSLVWAVLRLLLFLYLTDETGLWSDFGGWYFPSIFIFISWTALYYGVKYYDLFQGEHETLLRLESERQREAIRRIRAESDAREAQLKMLRYQLNPHFLFNTLNAIYALVAANKKESAGQMILHLSSFLRYSLEKESVQRVSLAQEIKMLHLYLQIEQARFAERMRVTVDIDPAVEDCEVPSLILQPLIENSIKYAIASSEEGGRIRIVGSQDRGRLSVSVEDSGTPEGADPEEIAKGTGVGLRNIRERLSVQYGSDFDLDISESELGGKMVTLLLPLSRHPEH